MGRLAATNPVRSTTAGGPTSDLIEERRGPVLWLIFNRPQARNAMTFAMYDRLGELAREINSDESLRCLVLTGAGDRAFVAGTDVTELRAITCAADAISYDARMERDISALVAVRVPTIAAIHGACTGAGLAIAGACDIRIASPSARFGVPVARTLGNCPSMPSLNLFVNLMGAARVREMIFTARLIGAAEARDIGLVSEVVESEEALMPRVEALTEQISSNAPLTLRAVKEGIRRILVHGQLDPSVGRDLLVECYMSEDFREGVEAFFEKRKPTWRGR